MADTIDDHSHHAPPAPTFHDAEPVPPTEQEPRLLPPPPPRSRRALVWIAALLSALVLSGAAAWVYFAVIRYEAVARHHVPGNAQVLVRLELAELALYGPVREQLLPALEARLGEPSAGQKNKTRRERVIDATGVDLGRDVRELVLATIEGEQWVLIAAGRIPRGRFIAGLERVLAEEKVEGFHRDGDMLVGPDGTTLGQAEDGALIVGTNANVVRACLPAESGAPALVLPEGPLTFAMTRDAAEAGFELPRDQVRLATGSLALGETPTLTLAFELAQGAAPEPVARSFAQALAKARPLLATDPESTALFEAVTVTPAPDVVRVTFPWTAAGATKACASLAQRVRSEPLGAGLLPSLAR